MTSLELARAAARALDSKKGEDVKILKVRDLTIVTDYFVIASGNSTTQVRALADEVDFQLSELGRPPLCKQGRDSASWVALDFGDVMVHVFYPAQREFYHLEKLWADAERIDIE